jgi:hypothetical protein
LQIAKRLQVVGDGRRVQPGKLLSQGQVQQNPTTLLLVGDSAVPGEILLAAADGQRIVAVARCHQHERLVDPEADFFDILQYTAIGLSSLFEEQQQLLQAGDAGGVVPPKLERVDMNAALHHVDIHRQVGGILQQCLAGVEMEVRQFPGALLGVEIGQVGVGQRQQFRVARQG